MMANKKIALIGTRGVPANYGGFETCVEEVGRRLVERGHSVTVYCRASYYKDKPATYEGMDLVYLPTMKRRSLETLFNAVRTLYHASRRPFDVLMVFGVTAGPILFLPKLFGKKVAINTDGLEWKRAKWGPLAKSYFKLAEWFLSRFADRVVTDSPLLKEYYKDRYGVDSTCIAYGAPIKESRKPELIEGLGLKPGEYFLQVTRFEPENNPLLTVQAYNKLDTDKKLVLVGGVKYESEYSRRIKNEATDRVLMPGFIYDQDLLTELWCNSYAYIHGNEVGGTNPALLQSMAHGAFVISVDVPYNREVLGEGGIFYEKSSEGLTEKMRWALENPSKLGTYKKHALERIEERYTWEGITDKYEVLFEGLVQGKDIGEIDKI